MRSYDPQTRTGEVAVSVVTGVFRLVGGKISKTGTITIKTPSATIGLRGGIGLFVVTAAETKAHFLFGISMAVAAKGRTETATRPGSLIVAKLGGTPGAPAVVSAGAVAAILALLETSKSATGDKNADEEAKKSGFSAQNSERGVDGTSGRGDGRSGDAQQAVSNATLQRDVGTTGSGSGGSSVTGVTGSTTPFFIGPAKAPVPHPEVQPLAHHQVRRQAPRQVPRQVRLPAIRRPYRTAGDPVTSVRPHRPRASRVAGASRFREA